MSGGYVGAAVPINDQATYLSLDGAPGMEDMLTLIFFLETFLGM